MARYSGKKSISDETRDEAMKLARGTQAPGQTKAQTRLIAQGIERGITLYKKEQKERARALDRRERQLRRLAEGTPDTQAHGPEEAAGPSRARKPGLAWLPWLLLVLTWIGIAAYWMAVRS